MAYETNRFCWHGCTTTNPTASKAFYTAVIGWDEMTTPMGDGEVSMFAANQAPFAHISESEGGVPSHWSSYLRVDDVDASTRAAVAAGGAQLVPPTDIPPGRFSVVASPSGAAVCLFHEADPEAQHHPGGVGGVHWVELQSTDVAADRAWLAEAFGYTFDEMPIPTGTYYILKHGDTSRGGLMAAQGPMPSAWLVWTHVSDVDETVKRTTANGGTVLGEVMEMPGVGRMAVVQDPTGGVLGVITPSA